MAVFDVILFLVVLLFAALGVRRGLVLTVCGLLSILVALGGAKVAADSLSPVVAEAITPRITTTVEDRLEKNVNQSMKDAGETAKDSLSGILSIFGNSETYEEASEQLQKAIQSGLKPSLESAAKSVAKDLAQPVAWWAVYGIVFCLILLVWELVSKLLNLVAKLPVLNLANRIMGGGIGLLKGVLVVGLVCWVILRLGLVTAAETQESVFLQFFSNFSWARG